MRRVIFMLSVVLATAVLAVSGSATASHTSENAAVYWNRIALSTVLGEPKTSTPSAAALYVGIAQAAVYDAVMAIEQTHEAYASSPAAPAGASLDAAVAAAAHDVLVEYFDGEDGFADQRPAIEAAYDAALADIPAGSAKDDGVSVGRQAAAAVIALRQGDGRLAAVPPPPDGDEPGEWRRTSGPTAVTPWTAQVKPFLVQLAGAVPAEGPDRLTKKEYAEQFEETRLYGAKTGSLRSDEQTEIAVFWTENTVGQYNRALRQLAASRGLSTTDSARLFAMTGLTAADAMITCWNTKYHFLFWRPITAIREADTDGNADTVADPAWTPLSTTGNHPEYVSGHACLTGAISRALREFLGTKAIDLTMDSTAPGTGIHEFATVDELRIEVENARIYGGDHFRKGGTDGTKLGDHLAKWALGRFFRKT